MGTNLRYGKLDWDTYKDALIIGEYDANGKMLYWFWGSCVTRATVLAEVGVQCGIGSKYYSSGGEEYIKVADNNAAADWEVMAHSAADTG